MYASQANEPTVEKSLPPEGDSRQRHGLFTFTLVDALRQCQTPPTYTELMQQIVRRYEGWGRTSPKPWLEGDFVHQPVLGFQPKRAG